MEDKEIVELYFKRDENAISQTAIKYENYCYAIANRILFNKEDSEECVNDTYLAAWNAIPPHCPAILSTFLGKITRRLSLNKWRANNAQKRGGGQVSLSFEELENCIKDGEDIVNGISETELSDLLNEFLKGLKESDRKVFVCRYWYFESIKDISDRFYFSESKTKMILKRTRDKLRIFLKRRGVLV